MLKELFKPKDNNLKALERLYIPLENILKDKIHQNYLLEKFLKDVKRLFKPKDNNPKALERLLSLFNLTFYFILT